MSVCPSSQCSVAWCRSTGRGLETTAVGDASEAEECFLKSLFHLIDFLLNRVSFHVVFLHLNSVSSAVIDTSVKQQVLLKLEIKTRFMLKSDQLTENSPTGLSLIKISPRSKD